MLKNLNKILFSTRFRFCIRSRREGRSHGGGVTRQRKEGGCGVSFSLNTSTNYSTQVESLGRTAFFPTPSRLPRPQFTKPSVHQIPPSSIYQTFLPFSTLMNYFLPLNSPTPLPILFFKPLHIKLPTTHQPFSNNLHLPRCVI